MGNALLRCLRGDCGESTPPHRPQLHQGVPHGVAALAHDLFDYEITAKVIDHIPCCRQISSPHDYLVLCCVRSPKDSAAMWFPPGERRLYKKLLEAWKEAKPTPKTPATAAILVVQTLRGNQKADLDNSLPVKKLLMVPNSDGNVDDQVDARDVVDGDGITAYVDTANPAESGDVPMEVQQATVQRTAARAARNYREADVLKKSISAAGYGSNDLVHQPKHYLFEFISFFRVVDRFKAGPNGDEILALKYRIRLRYRIHPLLQCCCAGADAEGRLCLALRDLRSTPRVCEGELLSPVTRRATLRYLIVVMQWEKEARAGGRGLWASSHPEKPWEWRKSRRNAGWRDGKVPVEVF
ncbi:hypothetical protein BHE74_00033944 [Ensete ventricosum]|nr:hypothetical protein BHE74_00033944 [Ensete ventricosum]RZS03382.1 hypothetical protein BHM03_00033556 [Ensete ventricosum]